MLPSLVKTLIGQRLAVGGRQVQGLSLNELLRRGEIEVHGVRLQQPDLSSESHSLAVTVWNVEGPILIHTMFNAYWEPLSFELPPLRQAGVPGMTKPSKKAFEAASAFPTGRTTNWRRYSMVLLHHP